MSTTLGTGSSRDLGIELKRFSAAVNCTLALSKAVPQSNASAVFIPLAVADEAQVAGSADEVRSVPSGRSLNILLSVSVIGAHNVLRQYTPLMHNSAEEKVIHMRARIEFSRAFGSITSAQDHVYAARPANKISKTALYALPVQYARMRNLTLSHRAVAVVDIVTGVEVKDNRCFRNICVLGWNGSDDKTACDGKDLVW
ncbi:hypothetical protein BDV10DRAFT_200049 [Aspergillus recurvatus]